MPLCKFSFSDSCCIFGFGFANSAIRLWLSFRCLVLLLLTRGDFSFLISSVFDVFAMSGVCARESREKRNNKLNKWKICHVEMGEERKKKKKKGKRRKKYLVSFRVHV